VNQLDIRDVFFDRLYELGSQNSNIIIISADMDAFSLRKFATDFPKQYMNIGVSEQNMINVAAGLAIAGKIVFCYSIASFATLRCLEQIKVNICSMNLPVTIVGAGAGFSFGYDGPTHHGHQDVSSMRLMPEMNIIELSSNDVAEKAVDYAIETNSPCYIRLDKGLFPNWSHIEPDFKKGYRIIRPLSDINLISNGFILRGVIDAAERLNERGVIVGIIDIFRFKPFPVDAITDILASSKKIVSIEESCKTGGLGTALSEVIAQNDVNCFFKVIGAPDKQFIEYGEREWFHEKYALSGDSLVEEIFNFLIK
jgi:transketolase